MSGKTLHIPYERLIPIETYTDEESEFSNGEYDHVDNFFNYHDNDNELIEIQTETALNDEINRRKEQNNQKFLTKWQQILDKYLKIDDGKESDEIDLVTGDIITDNGHLRSLGVASSKSTTNANIWATDMAEADREEVNERKRQSRVRIKKRQLRESLKQQDLFYKQSRDSTGTLIQPGEDSILLLTPSPTKKQKVSRGLLAGVPTPNLLPMPLEYTSRNGPMLGSPRRRKERAVSASKDIDENKNEKRDEKDENKEEEQRYLEFHMDSHLDSQFESHLDTSSLTYSPDAYEVELETSQTSQLESDSVSEGDGGFEDEYLIIVSSTSSPKRTLFRCPFEACQYCTGNKAMYKTHLLHEHSQDLVQLGYPVRNTSSQYRKRYHISDVGKEHLFQDFPLVHEVPHLPLTPTGKPIPCGRRIEGKSCKKWFLTRHELQTHLSNTTNCSTKRQVLLCPMLGCGFMTDEGYLSWRSHFIHEKHFLHPNNYSPIKRVSKTTSFQLSPSSESEDIPTIRRLLQGSETEFPLASSLDSGYDSIDELFSQ